MKNLKAADLRGKSVEELEQLVKDERAALFASRRDQVFRRLTDTASLSVRRHNIARALTIIGEKKRGTNA
ncbi:50S ribosomal protein L29 [bacterium]|nr:MAG: 50S ribosomal protein L29 [bacterium]